MRSILLYFISSSLLDELKSRHCRAAIGILHAAKSHRIKYWKELDGRITDGANEAKDNVKYLSTLDKLFIPLVKCPPVSEMIYWLRLSAVPKDFIV